MTYGLLWRKRGWLRDSCFFSPLVVVGLFQFRRWNCLYGHYVQWHSDSVSILFIADILQSQPSFCVPVLFCNSFIRSLTIIQRETEKEKERKRETLCRLHQHLSRKLPTGHCRMKTFEEKRNKKRRFKKNLRVPEGQSELQRDITLPQPSSE